jgi:hypothetical protein
LRKQGLKVAEIAAALGVKQRSVYNYLSRSAQFETHGHQGRLLRA